ncbi:signal peptidase I [Lacticaseibacillus daqingensis]|uniref:signal peptidase I n=1 Tax=Lacticaseibacillus daqingensis TaxID=2486014 RepID=UPI000F799623|nr:signal peptidase I [Lacticaseibacillus daqingensis]
MSHRRQIWISVTTTLLLLVMGFNVFFQIDHTQGRSMAPSLADGQWLVVARPRTLRWFNQPYRYRDIVIVANAAENLNVPKDRLLVKRLVGKPGDLIGVSQTTVYRNAKPISEPYVTYAMDNSQYDYGGVAGGGVMFRNASYVTSTLLKKNQYFILGDNRPVSADSRWFGPIKASQLRGKVVARLGLNDTIGWQHLLGQALRFVPLTLVLLWVAGVYWPDWQQWRQRRK